MRSVVVADCEDFSSSFAIGPDKICGSNLLGGKLRIRSHITNGRVARTMHCDTNHQNRVTSSSVLDGSWMTDTHMVMRKGDVVEHLGKFTFTSFETRYDLIYFAGNIG